MNHRHSTSDIETPKLEVSTIARRSMDLNADLQEKLMHPSGLSRRLSEVDILTKIEIQNCTPCNTEEHSDVSESHFSFTSIDQFTKKKSLKRSGCSIDSDMLDASYFGSECQSVSKILVLYTGGTIGMRAKNGYYQPQPNYFVKAIRKLPMFHDHSVESWPLFSAIPLESMPLVMPLSPERCRVVYVVYEYDPIIDSSDMTMDDWVTIGRDIEREYNNFDGFVVLHGTDTLSYTASALSFILENLGKPVVITGSQIPIFETRSDGRDNFLGALIVAGHCLIPEVTVYFHNQLFRGCRVTKSSTVQFDAFESPNFPSLVELGVTMTVHHDLIFKPYSVNPFCLYTHLCSNVTILRLFPSIPVETVRHLIAPPIQGVLIQSFGAGNVPSGRTDLLMALKEAADRGCLLLNISQCPRGPVKPIYEGGAKLRDIGVLCGSDMTPEAALTKLAYVLGKTEWSIDEKRNALERSLRGEVSAPRRLDEVLSDEDVLNRLSDALQLSSLDEARHLRNYLIPSMMCAAAKENKIDDLKRFTTMTAVLEVADYDNRTPLHLAATEGNIECVNHLLKEGALVHTKDRFGTTPLLNAVFSRHLNVIEAIQQTGGRLSLSGPALGKELYEAAFNNDVELLKMFCIAGASFKARDHEERNLLHAAAFQGHMDVVSFVKERSQENWNQLLNAKDGMGRVPREIALKRGHDMVARLLQPETPRGKERN